MRTVDKIFSGEIVAVYSSEILSEYNEVLRRPKFGFDENAVKCLISVIEHYGRFTTPDKTGAWLADIKDVPFYDAVMSKRSEEAYLVTGNIKHFPAKPFIVTPNDLLEILEHGKYQ